MRYLRKLRQDRNESQRFVSGEARKHGARLTQSDISEIERGRLVPTGLELAALAKVFNVSRPSVLLKHCTVVEPEPDVDDKRVSA